MKGHLEKKGKNHYKIILELGKDANGRRIRETPYFHGTQTEAEDEMIKLLGKLANGTYVSASQMTVGEYLEHWLEHYAKSSVSPRTYDRYAGIVRLHLVPALGRHKLSKLRPLHIASYYTKALTEGRVLRPRKDAGKQTDDAGSTEGASQRKDKAADTKRQDEEKDERIRSLSPQTVTHHHRVLRLALKQAVMWQMLAVNPADAVKPPRAERHEITALDEKGTAGLLTALEGSRFYLPALLAVSTGMRRGELLGLRWQDVDLKAGKLAVRQNLQQAAGGLVFKTPKTAKGQRSISLAASTVAALRRHKGEQSRVRLAKGPSYQDGDLVLCEQDGRPLSPGRFSSDWRYQMTSRGLSVRFHDLRHTHATLLLRQGTHPKVVSERLGHSTIGITLDTYSHVLPDMQDEAAKRLDGALAAALSAAKTS